MPSVNPGPASTLTQNQTAQLNEPFTGSTLLTTSALFAQSAIPFILAPTGTVTGFGLLTLGTALPTTYANAFVFLPAGALFAGSAPGWYFCQFTSATVGQLYLNTSNPPGVPALPTILQPITIGGPGAFTGATGGISGVSLYLPGGTLGPNGGFRLSTLFSVPGNTDTKTLSASLGGTTIWAAALAVGTNLCLAAIATLQCRGTQNSATVVSTSEAAGIGVGTTYPQYLTVNFQLPVNFFYTFNTATATDYIVLESWLIEILPG
jgi:hypothetical protein